MAEKGGNRTIADANGSRLRLGLVHLGDILEAEFGRLPVEARIAAGVAFTSDATVGTLLLAYGKHMNTPDNRRALFE